MKGKVVLALCALSLMLSVGTASAMRNGKLLILLIGDSTTLGTTPRQAKPEGPHLEQIITNLMACEEDMPPVEVINLGKGGETATSLFDTGRYDKDVAPYIGEGVDYIFVRYGINDWFKLKDLKKEFPEDLNYLFGRVEKDFPEAKLVPMTIVQFMPAEECEIINDMIKDVVAERELPLLDIYAPYHAYLEKQGINSLNVRGIHLDKVDAKYHEMLKDKTIYYRSKKGNYMKVISNDAELDALLGGNREWFSDRHPNLAGYNFIGYHTVEYLKKDLKKKR